MLDDFFWGLNATEHDVRASGKSLLVAGGQGVAPLLCGKLLGAEHLSHAVTENFGTGARHGTEASVFQNVQQVAKLHIVEFGDAHKFYR